MKPKLSQLVAETVLAEWLVSEGREDLAKELVEKVEENRLPLKYQLYHLLPAHQTEQRSAGQVILYA